MDQDPIASPAPRESPETVAVIDGVEWSPNPDLSKKLTLRVDAGYAGIGIAKYSGYSTERREPGLDSNNSTFDFRNIYPATPGWQFGG